VAVYAEAEQPAEAFGCEWELPTLALEPGQ
jgi:hypothetical protein